MTGPDSLPMRGRWWRAREFFALERNLVIVSTAMLLLALGENLWKKFLPKYLLALGAPIRGIGLFGTVEDLLDGLYQYPGGWLSDRFGRRHALLGFIGLAIAGYLLYAVAPTWQWIIAGLLLVKAWSSMASPTLFAVVADALPRERRAIGFTVQSILKRLPIAIAPIIGGLLIARSGLVSGMRLLFGVTVALAVVSLVAVMRLRVERVEGEPTTVRGVWGSFPRSLRWLLVSDIFIRACEALVDVFLVIYATSIIGISAPQYGVLIAVQMVTAMIVYVPAAKLADRVGRKPLVIATFLAFASFPVAVVLAGSFSGLVLAFVVGGLREIGEPSRKALILDFASPSARGRTVGLYYLLRSIAIAPAAFIGGVLWESSPELPFLAALFAGLAGTLLFSFTVKEEESP